MLFCNDFNNKILTDMDLAEAEKYNIIPEQSGISSLVRRNAASGWTRGPWELWWFDLNRALQDWRLGGRGAHL